MSALPDAYAITPVTYAEWRRRFGRATAEAGLPTKDQKSTTWYASEVAAGGVCWMTRKSSRMTRTVTLPEWRGRGYGEATIWFRLWLMRQAGIETTIQWSRTADLYLRSGFQLVGMAANGTHKLTAVVADVTFPHEALERLATIELPPCPLDVVQ